jgi:hypothetical protein
MGRAAHELPFAYVFKPDLRALLGVERPLALGGWDDGRLRTGDGRIALAIKITFRIHCIRSA